MSILVRELLKGKRVVLASQSPRRRELMHLLTDDFEIVSPQCEEKSPKKLDKAEEYPLVFSQLKCNDVVEQCKPDDNTIVIACDTVVIYNNEIFGKPKDEADALRMLKTLSGNVHEVVSALCVWYRGNYHFALPVALVKFRDNTEEELRCYISTGEPMDKAGAYGIQELGSMLVESMSGDYNTVVGLPVNDLAKLLYKALTE